VFLVSFVEYTHLSALLPNSTFWPKQKRMKQKEYAFPTTGLQTPISFT